MCTAKLTHLPGVACLSYPNALRPIVEKLPTFLNGKLKLSKMPINIKMPTQGSTISPLLIGKARKKNHPNELASGVLKEEKEKKKKDCLKGNRPYHFRNPRTRQSAGVVGWNVMKQDCPVDVFLQDREEKAHRIYAIVDDQRKTTASSWGR